MTTTPLRCRWSGEEHEATYVLVHSEQRHGTPPFTRLSSRTSAIRFLSSRARWT